MRPQSHRSFTAGFGVLFTALWLASHAGASVVVRSVDASAYPSIRATVVTDVPSKAAPRVREDGRRVAGLETANLAHSKSVVLAVDRSQSMRGQSLTNAASAALGFVSAKPASDSLSVLLFGSHAPAGTTFSTDPADARDALRTLAVDRRQGTAFFDAIVAASKQLDAQPKGGRVIIALTDGADVSSTAKLGDAVAAARSAGVSVYTIGITGHGFTAAPLRELAAATGGRYFSAANSSALAGVYSLISAELARTWKLHYLTSARPGLPVSLRVDVPRVGVASRQFEPPALGGASTGGSGVVPRAVVESPLGTLFAALAAGIAVLLGFALIMVARQASWVRARLEPHIAPPHELSARRSARERLGAVTTIVRATERTLGHLRQWRSLHRLLERADLPLRTAELVYIMLGCGLLVGLIAGIAGGSIAAFFGLVVGSFLPLGFVSFKAKRRLAAFENQLPDMLITLAASLKAGHSFRQGIQSVVEEGQKPASDELRRVLTDAQLGRPMEDSLIEMSERVGSKNFTFVITCVTIQRQVGGSLASLFDMVADTVRQRQQFARKIRSLTAMGRMSAYVLIGLPFGLAGILTLLNPSFMAPLFRESAGQVMIVVGLVMMTIGSLILKKIVSFRG